MIAAFHPVADRLSTSLLRTFAIVPALHTAVLAQAPQVRDPNSLLVGPPPVPPAAPPEPPVIQQDIEVPSELFVGGTLNNPFGLAIRFR